MKKTVKTVQSLFLAILLIGITFFFVLFLNRNQVVAKAEANKIYYNNAIYEETFEVFDFEKDCYLGRVEMPSYNSKCRLYSLYEKPAYLLVDMGFDVRIYKKLPDTFAFYEKPFSFLSTKLRQKAYADNQRKY